MGTAIGWGSGRGCGEQVAPRVKRKVKAARAASVRSLCMA